MRGWRAGRDVLDRQTEYEPRSAAARRARFMPDWPRGMPAALAAAYCGIGTQTLAQNGPKPIRIGKKRQVWLREDLDAWLDRLAGRGPTSTANEWLIQEWPELSAGPEKRLSPRARLRAKGILSK